MENIQTETKPATLKMPSRRGKARTLAAFLECKVSELKRSEYDKALFEYGNQEYLVLTDAEATRRCKASIIDSLWAFNIDFLSHYIPGFPSDAVKAFQEMQGKLCESANPIVLAMLGRNLNRMIADAISADGRGHFLSGYDGEENESGNFFIYRIN